MASEGEITSDIVKNAVLSNIDEVNAKFESLPMTFSDIGTSLINVFKMSFGQVFTQINSLASSQGFKTFIDHLEGSIVILASSFYDVLLILGEIASNPAFQAFANNVVISISHIINILGALMSAFLNVANCIIDNWSIIVPILFTVLSPLIAYYGLLSLIAVKEAVLKGIRLANAVATTLLAIATESLRGATMKATVTQLGLNNALLMCPIFWIITGIMLIVGALYIGVAVWNKFTNNALSATGIIVGAIYVAVSFIANLLGALYNLVIDAVAIVWNLFADFANFLANVFNNPIDSIIRLFTGFADTILSIISGIAGAIDTVFGSNLNSIVNGWRRSLNSVVDELESEQRVFVEKVDPSSAKVERLNYYDMFNKGYNTGSKIEDNVKNMFNFDKLLNDAKTKLDIKDLCIANINGLDGYDFGALDDIKNQLSGINDNTDKISKSVDISAEDLKYLRDIAEQEAINKYTTATINLNMTNNNNINSELDLDGVVNYLTETLNNEIEVMANGTYN